MDKNKYKTLAIGLDKEIYAELDKYCKEKSVTKSEFMRRVVRKILKKDSYTEKDNRIIKVKVDNYSELESYVKQKKLGSISTLIMFATNQYITKYPIKKEWKTLFFNAN